MDAAHAPNSVSLRPGTVLGGRYIIEMPLGAGGFGQVFRARQEPLGRAVAIKILRASTAAMAPDAKERFFREAQLAERLEHPNTVRVLDIGTTDTGLPFIVWELLRGTTLGDHLDATGKMNDAQVHRVTTQILKSLMEAHALGVVHRDIKPANIFITSHPGEPLFVKVLDFGIAKILLASGSAPSKVSRTLKIQAPLSASTGPSRDLTRESQALGTPRYMAPEQIAGDAVGPWTDLYAVGLVMAEMLTGKPVYESDSAVDLLLDRASGRSTPLDPSVARSRLFPVIARATLKMSGERYAHAAEMLSDLGLDVASAPVPTLPRDPTPVAGLGSQTQVTGFSSVTARGAGPESLQRRSLKSFWIALFVTVPLTGLLLLGLYIVYGRAPAHRPKRATTTTASAEPSTSPVISVATPPGPPPPAQIASRRIQELSAAQIERRVSSAGFALQSQAKEEKNAMGRFVNAPVARGECFGTVQYFDYLRTSDVDAIYKSMESMTNHHAMHRSGQRMVFVSIVSRGAAWEQCAADLLDAMTR